MITKTCEILVTDFDKGQVVAGTFTLDTGKLRSKPRPGFENMMKEIRKTPVQVGKKEYDPKDDPKGWIEHLPMMYNGAALRASLVEGKMKESRIDEWEKAVR